jgi:hypothetical protein
MEMLRVPAFNNLNDLLKYAAQQAAKSIQEDVAQMVIEVAKEHVQSDVYDVYPDPVEYQRTGELKDSFVATPTPDGVEIVNTRHDGERYIPEIIEYGHDKSSQGYEFPAYYPSGPNFIQRRPFMENTVEELKKTNEHVRVFKESMKKKGIDVK